MRANYSDITVASLESLVKYGDESKPLEVH